MTLLYLAIEIYICGTHVEFKNTIREPEEQGVSPQPGGAPAPSPKDYFSECDSLAVTAQ